MPDDRNIPTPAPSDVPTFKILKGDGTEINDTYRIMSVCVLKNIGKISEAVIILLDGDVSKEDFDISNTDDFVPGKEFEIKAGYHSKESTIFKGIVVKHAVSIKEQESYLTLTLKHKAIQASLCRKNKVYANVKDSDIIEQIISAYNLPKEVEATKTTHKHMLQYNCSDWDFINIRAEANQQFVFLENEKIKCKKPDLNQTPKYSIWYGSSLIEFESEIDARNTCSSVKGKTWSFPDQSLLSVDANISGINETGNLPAKKIAAAIGNNDIELRHAGKLTESELQGWANAQMQRSILAKLRGRARSIGYADIHPGDVINMKGVGKRFNGNVLVTGVRHEISESKWETDVQFGLDENWYYKRYQDIEEPRAGGLIPSVNGLQIGVVTKLESDPEGEDRILIKIPMISDSQDAVWARVTTLDAGKDRGSFFRPEPGDEVIVGFISDDPRFAVVLGMLNSSAKPAPVKASDNNNEKGFVTKSKLKFWFNDEKKEISIQTPGGNKLLISDDQKGILLQDMNGNKVQLNDKGISMESASDIKIKATGTLKIEAMGIEAQGSSQVKINSNGTTEIKGSAVMIN